MLCWYELKAKVTHLYKTGEAGKHLCPMASFIQMNETTTFVMSPMVLHKSNYYTPDVPHAI